MHHFMLRIRSYTQRMLIYTHGIQFETHRMQNYTLRMQFYTPWTQFVMLRIQYYTQRIQFVMHRMQIYTLRMLFYMLILQFFATALLFSIPLYLKIEYWSLNIENFFEKEAVSNVKIPIENLCDYLSVYLVSLCGSTTYIYHKVTQRYAQSRTKNFWDSLIINWIDLKWF